MARIGLCMIVKNEAHVIARCLESALPLVDYVSIVDTGSSDGTQQVIRDFLAARGMPGEVIDEPWRDFAYNRSFALRHLRTREDIDYALMIDADSVVLCEPGFDAGAFKASLTADAYELPVRLDRVDYTLPLLTSNRKPFGYRGVLHEFVTGPLPDAMEVLRDLTIHLIQDSNRNRNPRKYQDDAAVLEAALRHETDPALISRYTFYLAQSYRDAGMAEPALAAYLRRAEFGYWDQEKFWALYQAGLLKDQLGHPGADVIDTWLRAYEACPRRAESLHAAIRHCRTNGRPQLGYLLVQQALTITPPERTLFVETWIYEYGLLDEFAVVAYWSGHYAESFEACRRLLADGQIPAAERPRIRKNGEFAAEKLGNPTLLAQLPDEALPRAVK